MEIILIQPVKKLGKIGDLVNVRNGFGRNWLIPQGLAHRATQRNKELIASQKQEYEEKNNNAKATAELLGQLVQNKEIIFVRQVATDGKLFGSVSNKDIAGELSKILSKDISYSNISLEAPLKSLGLYKIEVNLHHDVTVNITVVVARTEPEGQETLRVSKIETQPANSIETE